MKRRAIAAGLVGLTFNGCTVLVDTMPAEPAPIAPVQFLRPIRDAQTGTWVANWVDPPNFEGGGQ
ncbi:MAG: hypothetical protein ACE5GE_05720 [Phycisphaerae bacterium]